MLYSLCCICYVSSIADDDVIESRSKDITLYRHICNASVVLLLTSYYIVSAGKYMPYIS